MEDAQDKRKTNAELSMDFFGSRKLGMVVAVGFTITLIDISFAKRWQPEYIVFHKSVIIFILKRNAYTVKKVFFYSEVQIQFLHLIIKLVAAIV